MIVPDVNLLFYAHCPPAIHHEPARQWLERVMNGSQEVALTGVALFGFLRLVTNRRVLAPPLAVDEALAIVEAWLARPHVRFVHPGPRHLEIAFRLLREAGTAGNLTTDVQLAALAIEYQGELHSADGDFGRFAGLRWVNPVAA